MHHNDGRKRLEVMLTRRDVLKSGTALTIFSSSSVLAEESRLGSTASGFNGGLTQAQSAYPSVSGDFPFINLLKGQANTWQGSDTTNSNTYIDPSWLDANG